VIIFVEGKTKGELVLFVKTIWFSVLNPAVRAAVTSKIQTGIVALMGYKAVVDKPTVWPGE